MFYLIIFLIILFLIIIGALVFFTFFFRKKDGEINKFYPQSEFNDIFDPIFENTYIEYSESFSLKTCQKYQNELEIKNLNVTSLDAKINKQTNKFLNEKITKQEYQDDLKKFSYLNLYLEEQNSKNLDINDLTYLSDETNFEDVIQKPNSTSIILKNEDEQLNSKIKHESLSRKTKNTSQMISLHREELLRRSLQETSKLNQEDIKEFVEDFFEK